MVRNKVLQMAAVGHVRERHILAIWSVALLVCWLTFELIRPSFIEVDNVEVHRSFQGDDPNVVYARTVHRNQRAKWTVYIAGTGCYGEGMHSYEKGDHAFEWKLFEDYMETTCNPDPGAYAMLTCYRWLWGLREHCASPVPVVIEARI